MILTVTLNPSIDKIYLINDYALGEVHRPLQTIASPGGKGLNVARVAKLMGEEVGATGPLGGGNGNYLRKGVAELGIADLFIAIEEETRICINVSDEKNQRCTEVLEEGPRLSEEEVALQLSFFDSVLDNVDVVTLSGSMAKGFPVDFYGQLIAKIKLMGKKVILDSSGEAFAEGVKAKPFSIKPNEEEIKKVYDGPLSSREDHIKAIKHFKQLGIELPIISLGEEGSLVGLSDGVYKVSIPPVISVNTVGSGDSFIAGLAVGISRNLNEKECIKLATACGTANTQFAQTGFVEQVMVTNYFNQVTLEKLDAYE
jgi:tagatose 6-phosphate kinase